MTALWITAASIWGLCVLGLLAYMIVAPTLAAMEARQEVEDKADAESAAGWDVFLLTREEHAALDAMTADICARIIAEVDRMEAEQSTPIHDDLAAERLRAELDDDAAIGRWLA